MIWQIRTLSGIKKKGIKKTNSNRSIPWKVIDFYQIPFLVSLPFTFRRIFSLHSPHHPFHPEPIEGNQISGCISSWAAGRSVWGEDLRQRRWWWGMKKNSSAITTFASCAFFISLVCFPVSLSVWLSVYISLEILWTDDEHWLVGSYWKFN